MYEIIAEKKSYRGAVTLAKTEDSYIVRHNVMYNFDGIIDRIETGEEFAEDKMYCIGPLITHSLPVKMASNDPYKNALAYFDSL